MKIFRAWHALQMENEAFLVQISPPADILLEVIRALVLHQKITNVAVLHGDEFSNNTVLQFCES